MELGHKGASLVRASTLVVLLLLAASSAFAETRVSVGIHVGGGHGYYGYGYYPPPPVVYRPPCPYPGYVWVPGYWYGPGPRYSWSAGYWAPPRHYHSGFYGRGYGYGGSYGRIDYGRGYDRRGWGDRGRDFGRGKHKGRRH